MKLKLLVSSGLVAFLAVVVSISAALGYFHFFVPERLQPTRDSAEESMRFGFALYCLVLVFWVSPALERRGVIWRVLGLGMLALLLFAIYPDLHMFAYLGGIFLVGWGIAAQRGVIPRKSSRTDKKYVG